MMCIFVVVSCIEEHLPLSLSLYFYILQVNTEGIWYCLLTLHFGQPFLYAQNPLLIPLK